jgi:hypothetical protein
VLIHIFFEEITELWIAHFVNGMLADTIIWQRSLENFDVFLMVRLLRLFKQQTMSALLGGISTQIILVFCHTTMVLHSKTLFSRNFNFT